ncbi:MAG: hypothetical protein ACJAV5_000755 [Vicingaceae bacterium]|jgi:hypothetical protein
MKKIILTFLGVLFLTVTASAQFATIQNNTDCTFYVEFTYVDEQCINPTTGLGQVLVNPGANFSAPWPGGGFGFGPEAHIVSATVSRIHQKYGSVCDVQFITPPPTCVPCTVTGPNTYTLNDEDGCCQQYTASWFETSCGGNGQNTTLLLQ